MRHHEASKHKSTNGRVIAFQKFTALLSRLAPPLATWLATRLFLTPMRTPQLSREADWAEGAERITIPSPLGPIPVWSWGDGPVTVLLVHGWSGRGLQLGGFVEPLVALGYRVVTHDAPGHGEADGSTSSMPAIAAALGAVARRFGPVSAVIAHSLGSTAAIYALAHNELDVDRFVAISPSARLHAVRERFGEMTGFPPHIVDRLRQKMEKRFGFSWDASEPLRLASAMPTPLMVIHDATDRLIPHSEGAELADAWPDGTLLTTNQLGHHRILRDPNVIDSAVSFVSNAAANTQMERKAS